MIIFDFITPSDPITFLAENEKVAYWVAILAGNGRAGCTYYEGDEKKSLPTLVLLASSSEMIKEASEYLGESTREFSIKNKFNILESLSSFQCISRERRKAYDMELLSKSKEEAKKFKEKVLQENQTSLANWVQNAWKIVESC